MRSTKGIMRLKKGSKVEVLNQNESPSGSWRCAEIISGNRRAYQVRYDSCLPGVNEVIERVSSKAIRPCPPPVNIPKSWVPGDVIEVFDNGSWRLAEVSKLAGGNFFFVRLLGTPKLFRAHISDLRLRQSWQDNKWIVIHKEPRKCSSRIREGQSKIGDATNQTPLFHMGPRSCRNGQPSFLGESLGFADDGVNFSRGTKERSHKYWPPVEDGSGPIRKIRIFKKRGRCQPVAVQPSSDSLKKVDAVASPHKVLGEKYLCASLTKNKSTGFLETDSGWAKCNSDRYFVLGSLNTSDSESVGSCSVNDNPYKAPKNPISRPVHDLNSQDDDVESCSGSRRELSFSTGEDLAVEVHRLELHAYRSTISALYASGPISWEKEILLTDLRIMLHISQDEHLLALRQRH